MYNSLWEWLILLRISPDMSCHFSMIDMSRTWLQVKVTVIDLSEGAFRPSLGGNDMCTGCHFYLKINTYLILVHNVFDLLFDLILLGNKTL